MEILRADVLSDGLQHVAVLRKKLEEELRMQRCTEKDISHVMLAFEEALVNAIKHGNQLDPEKEVRVRALVKEGELLIEIEDQGEGFDPDVLPDPTAPENLERPSGRGVFIMRAYMTAVEYERGGTLVRMRKVLG